MPHNINTLHSNLEAFIERENYESFDLFDALTCNWIEKLTYNSDFARRLVIQINANSPYSLRRIGMRKMIHTKLISDLLWTYSLKQSLDKAKPIYLKLIELKCKSTEFVWGLNFPYTSRFVNADSSTPNIYNTTTSGLALCEYFRLNQSDQEDIGFKIERIIDSTFRVFTFHDELSKGWFSYYPGQDSPTYNVNAITAYFFCKVNNTINKKYAPVSVIQKLINLLIDEQNSDGSWFYSRSVKGDWIDGFHTGYIIESLSYIYSHGYKSEKLESTLQKAWNYYINQLFTKDGFPKYFNHSGKYPIEAQNCAQAIQTLSTVGLWLKWHKIELLEKLIKNTIDSLYNTNGYFYHKKIKYFTYKQSYLRWSTAPMLVALSYADKYLESNH